MADASDRATGFAFAYFRASSIRRPAPWYVNTASTETSPGHGSGAGSTAAAHAAHGARPGVRQQGHVVASSTSPVYRRGVTGIHPR
jgi:hypothetical protein